jgi:colanic acid biosynthesis glycosyl transferase WcaI
LSQGLEALVEAAVCLRDRPDVQIVFQGEGVRKPELQRMAEERGCRNVTFLPFAAKSALSESFAAADLFVISLQRGLAGYIVPSKLYGTLASGRPYVAAVEETCEVASITRRYDCGVLAEPGNASDLARKIVFLHDHPETRVRMGTHARAASLEFDRKRQVSRYYDLFQRVTGREAQREGGSVPVAAGHA